MSSQYVPVAMKQQVFDRARRLCEYCRSPAKFAIDPLVMDHVEPVSLRGRTILENLALACQTCNNNKRDKIQAIDPVTEQRVGLFHPRQMIWSDHFVWNEDGT